MSENKHMKNKLVNTTLTASIILTAVIIGSASAAALSFDTSKSSDINVTINSEVALDVDPKTLAYSNVNVGEQVTTSDRDYRGITVENTGSEYIDKIWVNASTPSQRPFGSGIPTNYDAGNFLQIKLNTTEAGVGGAEVDDYYFVNRREYKVPDNSLPAYIVAPEDGVSDGTNTLISEGAAGGEVHVGRFRRGSEELWFVIATQSESTGDDACDGSGDAIIRVANVSSTTSRLGTVDFTDDGPSDGPARYDEYIIESSTDTSRGYAGQSVPLKWQDKTLNYDLLTRCSGTSEMDVVRTRFGVDVLGFNDLSSSGSDGYATEFLMDAAGTADDMLLPGGTIPIETAVHLPTGVSEGEVSQGKLTLFATADSGASVSP